MFNFFSANAYISILNVLTGILLARLLSVDDRGNLGQIILFIGFAVSLGAGPIKEYYLSRSSSNKTINKKLYLFSLIIALFMSLLTVTLYLDSSVYIYAFIFPLLNVSHAVLLTPIQLLGNFRTLGFYRMVVPSVYISGLLLISSKVIYINEILYIYIFANLLLLILLLYNFRKELFLYKKSESIDWIEYLKTFLSTFLTNISTQFDRIVVASFATVHDFGLYLIAFALSATPVSVFAETISSILVIKIKNNKNKLPLIFNFLLILIVGIFCCWLTLMLFGDIILELVFSIQYLQAVEFFTLGTYVSFVFALRAFSNSLFRGLGHNGLVLKMQSLTLIGIIIPFVIHQFLNLSFQVLLYFMCTMQFILLLYFNFKNYKKIIL